MPEMYELEMGKASYVVAHQMCRIKKGESVIITADSVMDFRPVEEIAKAAAGLSRCGIADGLSGGTRNISRHLPGQRVLRGHDLFSACHFVPQGN